MKKVKAVSVTVITLLVVVLYLLASATAYIPQQSFSLTSLLSVVYLPILALYIAVTLAWIFKSKRVFLVLFILLFAGYRNLSSTIAIHVFSSWQHDKATGTIRIMSWNVNRFGTPYKRKDSAQGIRRQMLRFIETQQPDILCLQDFRTNEIVGTDTSYFVNNINDILKAGGFKYFHYPYYYEYDGINYCDEFGVAIFSKYPLTDTGSIFTEGHEKKEKAAYADVMINQKPLRIFTCHLSSLSLWAKDEAGLKYLEGDSTRKRAKGIYSKVKYFGAVHEHQAGIIKSFLNKSPYPIIFTGDLNSVPSGYVYHHLKQGFEDAFLEKDAGIGGTYNRVFPKLRIDVLFHSGQLEVVQFIRPAIPLSDHFPIIADIRWNK